MAKVRVQLWNQPSKYAVLDTAGAGATIGVNVFMPDGSLFNPATSSTVVQAPAGPPSVGGVVVTVWGAIQDKPANIGAVEALSGAGVVTRNGSGALTPKALVQGPNVTIAEDATSITISSAGGNTATGTGGLWDLGDRIAGLGRFDGGTRV